MNDVITIPSANGSLVVDFEQKKIMLNREGPFAQAAHLESMSIPFEDITDIELKEPSFAMLGMCHIIIKNIRYVTNAKLDFTNFAVNKNDFDLLRNTLQRVLTECNLGGFKAANSVAAEKVIYAASQANSSVSDKAQNAFNQKREEAEKANENIDAVTEAKLFAQSVELQLLKAPSSAKFCALEEMTAVEVNGIYTVSGYVDSQNSYGAMIRAPFTLRVYKDATGWKSADSFQDIQTSINKKVAKNMLLYWVLGLIGAVISFAIMYAIVSSSLGL